MISLVIYSNKLKLQAINSYKLRFTYRLMVAVRIDSKMHGFWLNLVFEASPTIKFLEEEA